MMEQSYLVLFDMMQVGYKGWEDLGLGMLLLVLAVMMLVFHEFIPMWPLKVSKRTKRAFAVLVLVIMLCVTAIPLLVSYIEYFSLANAMKGGDYATVEGVVADVVERDAKRGHAYESFTVDNHRFSYSDYVATPGFNHTRSEGGPICPGMWVRISYVGDIILRLEVRKPQDGGKGDLPPEN